MITIHHLNNSRSHRIIWLLEELGVPYDIKYYQRDPKTMRAPDTLRKVHPLGLAPIITDGDITLSESGAIIEYILYKYGDNRLKPAIGSPEWNQYNFWMHFAEGTLMPYLLIRLVFDNTYHHLPFFIKPIFKKIKTKVNQYLINPRLERLLSYIESTLETNAYLTGNAFTAADIQMAIPLLWAAQNEQWVSHKPKIHAYIEQLKGRPAFAKTLEKGGDITRVKLPAHS